MGFNSAFKGLISVQTFLKQAIVFAVWQSVFATMYTSVIDANVM